MDRIVVAGASLAGLRAAESLRRGGFTGSLVLVGDEPHLPYDRPPLSKQYLAGTWSMERVWLRPDPAAEIDMRLGTRAVGLDLARGEVQLDDGEGLAFDGLVVATGASPRTLPGFDDALVLRTLDDCHRLRDVLAPQPRVAVIGAGFIGSEVASTARALGCEVALVEVLALPLARVFPAAIGEVCAALHRDHGVDLQLGATVASRADIDADVVVVGIGVRPNTGWLEGSGLEIDDGVVCDATSAAVGGDGRVVAAGDVARWFNPRFGQSMRVEHWTNAAEQAEHAASTLLGGREPYAPVPYFWSDQYDAKIQFVGVSGPTDELRVLEGALDDRKFVAGFHRDGTLVGALAFSMPRQLMRYRNEIAEATAP